MLIDISLQDKKQLVLTLDPSHPKFPVVFIMVKSLLGAVEKEDNSWTVQYDDLKILRNQLDLAGLTEDREMSNEAGNWLDYLTSLEERNDAIKLGKYNDQMKELLEGKLKCTPYKDQYPAIAYLYYNKRCGLFDSMGAGKSLCALSAASIMPGVEKILVIVPCTPLIDFNKQVKKHTYFRPAPVPQGSKPKALQYVKAAESSGDFDVMLVHPENLIQSKGDDPCNELCRLLIDMPWDLIILDEFHNFKNLSAKRTQCIIELIMNCRDHNGKAPRVVPMTGTPVSESPLNAYVFLKIANYGKSPHISRFDNHFVVKELVEHAVKGSGAKYGTERKMSAHLKTVGFKNLDELKMRLERVSIRRSKDDMEGFPPLTILTRELTLEGQQKALYATLCGELRRELSYETLVNVQKFLDKNETAIRLRQCLNHPSIIGGTGDSAKYVELDNILEELLADPEQKVVIWTEFRAAVDLLFDRYNELYGAVKIYGGVSSKELEKISTAFESSGWPRVAVCIPAKAGTGTDWLARARTAIYVDRPYSLVLSKQSLDRIHRRVELEHPTELDLIRAKPATIIFLDILGSVDMLVKDKMVTKEDMVEAVTTPTEKLIEMGREDLLKYLQ
jgi:SNF2 family DNA or RNA helicase